VPIGGDRIALSIVVVGDGDDLQVLVAARGADRHGIASPTAE
jgi:hypothetical protein